MPQAGDMWAHRGRWLWDKTDGHCAYCGVAFASPADMTTDHLVSRASGGDNSRENRFPCCRSCNSIKNHRPLSYLRDALQRRLSGRPAFTVEQLAYLATHGLTLPHVEPYVFYWEKIGNAFPEGIR